MAYKFIKGKNRISGSQTFLDALSGSTISASYFVGDGSQLTNINAITTVTTTGSVTGSGIVANPITLKDPLVLNTITASIGFNGNLYGTASHAVSASFATTASFAENASNVQPGGLNTQVQFNSGSTFSGSQNLTFEYTVPRFTINSGFVVNRTTTSGNLTLTPAQHVIGVDTLNATGNITISLPDAATLSNGQTYIIKDEGGVADNNTITIDCSLGIQTIDGTNSIILESPYAAINIYTNGIDKYYIY